MICLTDDTFAYFFSRNKRRRGKSRFPCRFEGERGRAIIAAPQKYEESRENIWGILRKDPPWPQMICSSEKGEERNSFLFSRGWGAGGSLFLHWRKRKPSLCFGKSKSPPFCTCGKMMKSGLSLLFLSPPFLNFPAASFPFSFSPRQRDGRPNSPSSFYFFYFFFKTFPVSPQFQNARSGNTL